MNPLSLTCPCGEVEIAISGDPIAQFYCHCDDCQRVHGAAYVGESAYRAEHVSVVRGEVTTWALKRSPRVTCAKCGTRMFIDVTAVKIRGVNAALFKKASFKAEFHMQCRFAANPVKDDLPHWAGRAPKFGGTDDKVEW